MWLISILSPGMRHYCPTWCSILCTCLTYKCHDMTFFYKRFVLVLLALCIEGTIHHIERRWITDGPDFFGPALYISQQFKWLHLLYHFTVVCPIKSGFLPISCSLKNQSRLLSVGQKIFVDTNKNLELKSILGAAWRNRVICQRCNGFCCWSFQ